MADFYGNLISFKAYCLARSLTYTASDDQILAGLLLASEHLDARYRSLFEGVKTGERDQVREWPRIGHVEYYGALIPSDETPREVEHSTYQLALREINTPGILSVDYTPSLYKQVSVDGAVAATFNNFGSAAEIQAKFQAVVEIMSSLFYSDDIDNSLSGPVQRV